MKYNLGKSTDLDRAFTYLSDLAGKEALVELKKISPTRTLMQNNYLHLIIGAFGNYFGYTPAEAKIIYKEVNKHIYLYQKNGRTFLRSSSEVTKEDMAKSIDKFREASEAQGCPLPLATDQGWLMEIANEIERSNYNYRG